nr:hypothetical protein [Phytohabitans flavus]
MAEAARPWRNALVSASCTIRYTDRSRVPGSSGRSGSTRTRTRMPASSVRRTSRGSASSPGRRSASSSRRSTPSTRSSSSSASRPVRSTPPRISRAFAGSPSRTTRAAPVCTSITLIVWPSRSCSSRAMRARSSVTAVRRSRRRSLSCRSRRRAPA